MVTINNLFETVITTEFKEYNVNETFTVTITLIDFNGNPVNRNNVQITCNIGQFSNNSQTFSSNTNQGRIEIEYQALQEGIVTFKCNDIIYEVLINSYSIIEVPTTNGNSPRFLYVNHFTRTCIFSYYCQAKIFVPGSAQQLENISQYLSGYEPLAPIKVPSYRGDIQFTLRPDGVITYRSINSNNVNFQGGFTRFEWSY